MQIGNIRIPFHIPIQEVIVKLKRFHPVIETVKLSLG